MSKEEMKEAIDPVRIDANLVRVTIYLYMKEKGKKPVEEMIDSIKSDTEEMENLPPGTYRVYLNDNDISTEHGMGTKKSKKKSDYYIVTQ